jgi:hypothetical protein
LSSLFHGAAIVRRFSVSCLLLISVVAQATPSWERIGELDESQPGYPVQITYDIDRNSVRIDKNIRAISLRITINQPAAMPQTRVIVGIHDFRVDCVGESYIQLPGGTSYINGQWSPDALPSSSTPITARGNLRAAYLVSAVCAYHGRSE